MMDLESWNLQASLAQLEQDLAAAQSDEDFEAQRIAYLSKKRGLLPHLFAELKKLPGDKKRLYGKDLNQFRQAVEQAFKERKPTGSKKKAPKLDLTLPGVEPRQGSLHPVRIVWDELCDYFISMGFDVAEGPEIENTFYNFEALNTPADHPAREEADTFYINDDLLLRTQTSGVQIRYMQQHQPPFRMVAPGKVYRRDDDVTHSPMFHQLEGLVVGENITFSDLKGSLAAFAVHMFGPDTKIRLRPSFFPFTEPSAEVDVTCPFCQPDSCRVCKKTGWIEILGCGMVDPNVFKAVGYDPDKVTGFAWGMGIERIAMLRLGIPDIRYLYTNDRRFLDQFKVG